MVRKICVFLAFFLTAYAAFAEGAPEGGARTARPAQIKLASLVPEASPWGEALNKMASSVARDTNNEVTFIIYHGGTAGGESDVLRKLRMNQVQAAIFTSFGLNEITPEILTLSAPLFIRNDGELDYVLKSMKPLLEGHINSKGFKVIAWSKIGFVNFFSKQPFKTPDELRKLKIGSSETEVTMTNVFKSMGYQIVLQPMNQSLINLNTGRTEVIYTDALSAASFQLFGIANNMMDFPLAPFMGGIVMNDTAWKRLSESQQNVILKYAAEAERDINAKVGGLRDEAIAIMQKNGLNIYKITQSEQEAWYKDMEAGVQKLVGSTFDAEIYRRTEALLKEYRSKN